MRPGAEGQLGLRAGATRGVEVEHTHTSHRLVATLWPVVRPTRRSHDSRWRRYIPRSAESTSICSVVTLHGTWAGNRRVLLCHSRFPFVEHRDASDTSMETIMRSRSSWRV